MNVNPKTASPLQQVDPMKIPGVLAAAKPVAIPTDKVSISNEAKIAIAARGDSDHDGK